MDDDKLIQNSKTFERLYTSSVQRHLFQLALRRVGHDNALANDILQNACFHAIKYMHTYRGDGPFQAWMRRILINEESTWHKNSSKKRTSELLEHQIGGCDDRNISKFHADNELEALQTLVAPFDRANYFGMFELYDLEGFSHIEIAEIREIAESTSCSGVSRVKPLLQNAHRSINL